MRRWACFNSYYGIERPLWREHRQSTVEWFVQDTWKVNRRLTINAGIRWSWAQRGLSPYDGQLAQFALSRYNPSQAPPLFRPVLVNGVRQAQNPLTGALLPAPYIGLFVPGVGNPGNGGVVSGDPNYPRGFINQQPVLWGPRLGFAYDPFRQRQDRDSRRRGDPLHPARNQVGQHRQQASGRLHADRQLRRHAHLPADAPVSSRQEHAGLSTSTTRRPTTTA